MALHAGIEIDGGLVRIAVLDVTSKQTVLVDFIEETILGDTADERVESLRSILQENLTEGDRKGGEVASSIPTRLMTLRDISVPFTKDEVIQKTIRYESEGHIPGVSIDDLIIDYLKCSETEDSAQLIIGAIDKGALGQHLEIFKDTGVDPARVEIDGTALASAFHVAHEEMRAGRSLIVAMEAGHTDFALLEEGRIIRLRSTANHLRVEASPSLPAPEETDEEVAQTPEAGSAEEEFGQLFDEGETPEMVETSFEEMAIAVVSDEEFDQLQVPGVRDVSQVPVSSDDMVARLITEIQRTFAGYLLRNPIDRIIVSGKVAKDLDLVNHLSEAFDVPAQQLRICDKVESSMGLDKVDRCNDSGAIAVGLALGIAGQGLTAFDLRKEEFRYERRFAKLVPGLILLGLILCFASIAHLVSSHREQQLRMSEYQAIRNNQTEIFRARFGEDPKLRGANTSIVAAAERKINELKGGSSANKRTRLDEYLPIVEMIEDVTKGVASARPEIYPEWLSLDLSGLKRKDQKSTATLRVPDAVAANNIAGALESSTKFFRIEDDVKEDKENKKLTLNLFLLPSASGARER